MPQIYMARNGPVVLFRLIENPALVGYQGAKETADELDDLARLASVYPAKGEYEIPGIGFQVREANVLMRIIDADEAAMPWPYVARISNGMRRMARDAEEFAKAHDIAADQAFLLHIGLPIALTHNKDILKEARQIARNGGY